MSLEIENVQTIVLKPDEKFLDMVALGQFGARAPTLMVEDNLCLVLFHGGEVLDRGFTECRSHHPTRS